MPLVYQVSTFVSHLASCAIRADFPRLLRHISFLTYEIFRFSAFLSQTSGCGL